MAQQKLFIRTLAVSRNALAWPRLAPVLIALVSTLAYWNSLSGAFLFDDVAHILRNERIRQLWPLSDVLSGRRPVVDLTLAVNFALGALDVTGYHVVNLAVHILAALSLYGVVWRTAERSKVQGRRFEVDGDDVGLGTLDSRRGGAHAVRRQGRAISVAGSDKVAAAGVTGSGTEFAIGSSAPTGMAPWLGFATAVLWAVHPLQTQSVTYLIQRAESLMGLFYLLTLYCVIRGAGCGRLSWYAAAVAACALGMGSKAVMVTAPVAVLLYDRFFLSGSFLRALGARWGLYVGLAATWGVLVVTGVAKGVIHPSGPRAAVGFGFTEITPWSYALTQFGVIVHYLKLCLWPRALCLDYAWPVAHELTAILLPAVVILMLLAAGLWGVARRTWWGFPVACYFLVLAPTSSIVPIQDLMFEHRVYLPLAAVTVLAVPGLWHVVGDLASQLAGRDTAQRGFAVAVLAGPALLLCAGTVARNRDYRDLVTMWRNVTEKRPENARAFEQLGTALVMRGDTEEAIVAYRRAVDVDAEDASAYANLGNALLQTRRFEEAADAYRQVLRFDPDHVGAAMNLAHTLDVLGRRDEALDVYQAAAAMTPPRPDPKLMARAHANLGSALGNRGDLDAAIEQYQEAVRLWPEYANAHFWWGMALARQGDLAQAVQRFRDALAISPDHTGARRALEQAEQRLQHRNRP